MTQEIKGNVTIVASAQHKISENDMCVASLKRMASKVMCTPPFVDYHINIKDR